MSKPWSDKLRKIQPYVAGEQSKNPNIIKLNANENPYPPSPKVKEVLSNFNTDNLKKYPASDALELKNALAKAYNLNENQIFMGNGSDDVLALCFQAFFCSDKPILFPDLTYSFYPVWCSLFKTPYKNIPLDENFRINPDDYKEENGGVILPNPNAPTGIYENLDFIEKILNNNTDCIVIIDEAYIDFGGESTISLLDKYENLVVVQTMSKSRSLAGLRVGYAFASAELISVLEAVKNSYNSYTMDSIAISAAAASLADNDYFKDTCNKIINTRQKTIQALEKLDFDVVPSMANFVLATHKSVKAVDIFEKLKAQNIFVRYFKIPRIDNYLRITIGTDDEMDKLFYALKNLL